MGQPLPINPGSSSFQSLVASLASRQPITSTAALNVTAPPVNMLTGGWLSQLGQLQPTASHQGQPLPTPSQPQVPATVASANPQALQTSDEALTEADKPTPWPGCHLLYTPEDDTATSPYQCKSTFCLGIFISHVCFSQLQLGCVLKMMCFLSAAKAWLVSNWSSLKQNPATFNLALKVGIGPSN